MAIVRSLPKPLHYQKMELTKLALCLSLLLQAIFSPNRAFAKPKVPCFFIFGDSLVDNGNNVFRKTSAKVNYYPYGIDYPSGPTGRFSNGRNVADFIAQMLGFNKCIPPHGNGRNLDILRGVNYGSGGAGILHNTGRNVFGDVITFDEQLSNHKITISRLAFLLGGKKAAEKYLSKCIYSVGFGNNDYLAYYLPEYFTGTAAYKPEQFAALLAFRYSAQLRRLYDGGARKIAVSAVGKLGCLPQTMASYGGPGTASCVGAVNEVVVIFNEFLEVLVGELEAELPGAKFVITRDSSNATSYGGITVATEPCCQVSTDVGTGTAVGQCLPKKVPCGNREEYMFWDGFHPTEAANLISARIAYGNMSPLYAADDDRDLVAVM